MTAEVPESSIPDDAWEEFQRESEGPARLAAPKEPSARARMVAERLRLQDEEAARRQGRRWGRKRKTRVQAEPDGWRAWPVQQQRQKSRRSGWGIFWVVVAVVLVLLLLNPARALGWLAG